MAQVVALERIAVAPMIRRITPSNDKTGRTDRRNWQKVADACCTQGAIYQPADTLWHIVPDGHYWFDRPVRIGSETQTIDSLVNPPAIRAESLATISPGTEWNGDDYLIRMFGVTRASQQAVTRLENLQFDCEDRCRGLLVVGFHQYPRFASIHVRRSLRVGLDALACYTSRWEGIHIDRGNGYAARFGVFNSASLRDIRIANMQCTQWPADDDAVAVYEDGTPWNIPATHGKLAHAAMYLDGNCFEVGNLSFEGNHIDNDPLLQLPASSAEITSIRCEANVATRCKVRIVGTTYTDRGHHNRIHGLYVRDSAPCASDVESTGNASHNIVDGVNSNTVPTPITP